MSGERQSELRMGDPAGVGPEVICKAIAASSSRRARGIVVIGSGETLERAAKRMRRSPASC